MIILFTKCMSVDITLISPPGSVHKLHYTMILVGYPSPSHIGYSHESLSPPGLMGWHFDVNMDKTIPDQKLQVYSPYSMEFPCSNDILFIIIHPILAEI